MKQNLTILLMIVLFGASLSAQVPQLINYQGYYQENGVPVTGNMSFKFRIYSNITGGTQVWQSPGVVLSVINGIYSYLLGSASEPAGSFEQINWATGNKFLEVEVNRQVQSSRVQFLSVPFALQARNSEKLENKTVSQIFTSPTISGDLQVTGRIKDQTGLVMPVGTILAYGGITPPQGWLLCDGTPYSSTQYPELYRVILKNFGNGSVKSDGWNPSSGTDFNVPDLRGRFLRGWDGVASNDPDKNSIVPSKAGGNLGNQVGTYQGDEFKSHNHPAVANYFLLYPNPGGPAQPEQNQNGGPEDWSGSSPTTGVSGGNETRPRNIYVNYIIKY